MRTNVILAGKCGSHGHSTTSFSENMVVAKTSCQILGILSFCDRERAFSLNGNKRTIIFVKKKSTVMLSGVSIFREQARKL